MKKTATTETTATSKKERIVLFKDDDAPVYIIDGEIICIGFCQCCPACFNGKCVITRENY